MDLKVTVADEPRSLRSPAARQQRLELLGLPHMTALNSYVQQLRKRESDFVPDFDPLDGGTEAQILFLLEKPGPMTAVNDVRKRSGSGFISRNNDDPTAQATFTFMLEAGLGGSERKLTVTWNLIPWWNGTLKFTGNELQAGLNELENLLILLPKLKVVVLVGNQAARAESFLLRKNLEVIRSAHPSQRVRNSYPEKWSEIPKRWALARDVLQIQ